MRLIAVDRQHDARDNAGRGAGVSPAESAVLMRASQSGAATLMRVRQSLPDACRRPDRALSEDVAPGREVLPHRGERAARQPHAVVVLAHDLAGEHGVRADDVVEQMHRRTVITSSSVGAIAREMVCVRVSAVRPTASSDRARSLHEAGVGRHAEHDRPARMKRVAIGTVPGRRINSPGQYRSSRADAASASASPG